jgi:RND family efflux transporter MFP subunit
MTNPSTELPRPHRGRVWRTVLTAFAILSTALAAACGGAPADAPGGVAGGRGAMPPMPVEVLELVNKPVEQTAEFIGTVKSRRSTTIQPQAEGIITRILVTSGQRVSPGTALFQIDAASQQAAFASLESVRIAREADAAYAKLQADRAKNLLSVGAMSQQEFEQAQTQQKTAEAQLKSVDEQIRQQQAELAYYRVTAPTAGVVGDIPVRQGDRITKSTVLTTVDDNAGYEIYINVPVQQAPRLRVGLPVRVVSDTNEVLATEKVSFVSPSVDDATQTVLVKTPLAPQGGRFRTDQFVRVHVVYDTAPGVTIPVTAVTRINGVFFVFAVESGERGTVARQKPVTLGPVIGSEYVVLTGLSAGDKVVIGGIQKIGDGAPVAPMPPGGRGPNGGPAAPPAGGRGQ